MRKTGLKPEEIGIIFISPCPSKVSYAKSPLGIERVISTMLSPSRMYILSSCPI